MYQTNPPQPPQETLPTMYDLPSELVGESGLPDEFHIFQPRLLSDTCQPTSYSTDDFLVATDLNLYYDVRHPLWYKRPDWYVVLEVPRTSDQDALRLSYVIWQEGVDPFLVVELLSPGTEQEDLGKTLREVNKPPTKWQVYEQILRVPYYVVYDRYTNRLRVFRLEGTRYQELLLPKQRLWLEEIDLGLGIWRGTYEGLQVCGCVGMMQIINGFPYLQSKQSKNANALSKNVNALSKNTNAQSKNVNEQSKNANDADRLAEYLRSQGIDPDNLPPDVRI